MSRGPGKWQRSIIDALATRPALRLRDLLPRSYSVAQHQALYRAAPGPVRRWHNCDLAQRWEQQSATRHCQARLQSQDSESAASGYL